MTFNSFTPPIQSHDIISLHENEKGEVDSLSLFVVDSLEKYYTLQVTTQELAEKLTAEAITDEPDDELAEPEFVIPDSQITVEDVEQIINISPNLLKKYLVPQLPAFQNASNYKKQPT